MSTRRENQRIERRVPRASAFSAFFPEFFDGGLISNSFVLAVLVAWNCGIRWLSNWTVRTLGRAYDREKQDC